MAQQQFRPPELAQRLLRMFVRNELAEEVTGDLDEKFQAVFHAHCLRRARWNYWYQVMNYLRPFALKHLRFRQQNFIDMYGNYVTVGWRNLLRNKSHAVINIGGLSIGMAVVMLIGLWVFDELTFNHDHENYERIARVYRNGTLNGETGTSSYMPAPLAAELREKYGDNFRNVASSIGFDEHVISKDKDQVTSHGQFAEPGLVDMLSLHLTRGTINGFNDPHAVLISSSLATVLFGKEDALDKDVRIDNIYEGKVIGVYKDIPGNSDFSTSAFFASWQMYVSKNEWIKYQTYSNNMLDVYVELQPKATVSKVSNLIKDIVLSHISEHKDYVAVNPQLWLHPMDQWHLWGEFKNGKVAGGRIQFVWMFGLVGFFVLILACINFMNLSTARSEKRAREVGIRKVMGSMKSQLVAQFFSEAFLVVVTALIISLLLVTFTLAPFNDVAGKSIVMPWKNFYFWSAVGVFTMVTTIISGSYPALYLSSFQPVSVLKGIFRGSSFTGNFRKVLVVVQFTVSITLIIGTVVVYQQIQFGKNRQSGYDNDGLVMVRMSSPEFKTKVDVLRTELQKTGYVEEVAQSGGKITNVWSSQGGFSWPGKDPQQQVEFAALAVAPEYGRTVGWKFIAGKDFSRGLASDSTAFVVTKSAAALMGLKDPIGQTIHWKPGWMKDGDYKLVGIIEDLVMESPFETPMPTVFFINGYVNEILNIRLVPGKKLTQSLTAIESVFHNTVPGVAFDFKFADVEYNAKFSAEERIGNLSTIFATLAIAISCIGLIGLSSFIAEQRMKEMGIRKVLGASASRIWGLFSRDFLVLVLISTAISIPVSSYTLGGWLGQYSYKMDIAVWLYVFVAAGAMLLTLITISFQTIKVALINPAKILKSE